MGLLTSAWEERVGATLENPRFTLNSPEAYEYLGGEKSSTGIRVGPEKALTFSPWWRGLTLLSGDVAKLPLVVFKRLAASEGKERDKGHQAYFMLRRKPNQYQTANQFKRQLTGHALSRGNGYAYIVRSRDATPTELWPLDPDNTYPVRANGVPWYVTELKKGVDDTERRKLAAEDVLHIRGFSFDGLTGYNVVEKARESLGLGMATQKSHGAMFKNNARPGVVLETPAKLEKKAKDELREAWERMHAGLDNAHRTAVLDNGLKANPFSFNAEDSQTIQTLEFTILDIANFLGIPPHKLGHPARTAYASLEQENQSYLDESLDPWLVTWEEECWDKLLTEEEKEEDTHTIEFVRQALVRADLAARANYFRTATGGRPWMVPDEVRVVEDMNPLGGEAGELLTPLNMGQGGAQNEPKPAKEGPVKQEPAKSNEEDAIAAEVPLVPSAQEEAAAAKLLAIREAHRELLVDGSRRMVRRVGVHARRAAKKPATFLAWLDSLEAEHGPIVIETFAPLATATTALTGKLVFGGDEASRFFARFHENLLKLSGECKPADLEAAVDRWMTDMEATLPVAWANELLREE